MEQEEFFAWLGLARALVLQSKQVQETLKRRGSAAAVFFASPEELEGGMPSTTIDRILDVRRTVDLQQEAADLERHGIRVLTWNDEAYPTLLKQIGTPPPLLFYRGALPESSQILVSMVGARHATIYGRTVTRSLVAEAVTHGIGIVSGLAFGIDETAHKTTLEQGGYTIAVLGGSLDDASIAPSYHRALANEIVQSGGCLLSEYPTGTLPQPFHFPVRNRIIAGLSPLTVVVEAAGKSGSLITAQIALEENRDVAAVPGPITSPTGRGTNQLIKDGAHVIVEPKDVLGLLNLDRLDAIERLSDQQITNADDRALMEVLSRERHDAHTLAHMCNLPVADVLHRLTLLELKGLVQSVGSGYFEVTGIPR